MNFDSEDYHRAYSSDCISYHQRPVCGHTALYDKEYRAERKHYEGCERYAAGIARADSRNGLRQITEYHTYGGTVAEDICDVDDRNDKNDACNDRRNRDM